MGILRVWGFQLGFLRGSSLWSSGFEGLRALGLCSGFWMQVCRDLAAWEVGILGLQGLGF